MREKTIKLYTFGELPTEAAKERVRDWFAEAGTSKDDETP